MKAKNCLMIFMVCGLLALSITIVMLNELDKKMERMGLLYVRYSDDLSIHTKSEHSARKTGNKVYLFLLDKLKLRINREKMNRCIRDLYPRKHSKGGVRGDPVSIIAHRPSTQLPAVHFNYLIYYLSQSLNNQILLVMILYSPIKHIIYHYSLKWLIRWGLYIYYLVE